MPSTASLIGIWSGCAFPTQETTVVFCGDGQGLMFFYWGSCAESPFVDEFEWSLDDEGHLHVTWRVCHQYDYGDEEDEEAQENEENDQHDDEEPPVIVTSGKTEVVDYELRTIGERSLRIELGFNEYFGTFLDYAGAPRSFYEEKDRCRAAASDFDPFGPGRQVWTISEDNHWRPAPNVVLVEESAQRQKRQTGLNFLSGWTLMLVSGTLGQVAFFADLEKVVAPMWLGITLHSLPTVCIVLTEDCDLEGSVSDNSEVPGLVRLGRGIRKFGALWYLAMGAALPIVAAAGWRPEGWPLFAFLSFLGLIPCYVILRSETTMLL